MPIRYFIKQLLLPPGILLLLLALAWWFRRSRPRLAGCCFALGFGGMWLISLPVMVEWGARALETEPPLAREDWSTLAQRADAIVVLGSGRERGDPAWGTDQPTGTGLERQRYAARLAKASGLPVLHVDLYRIEDPAEVEELGLDDARESGALLIEWPSRLGDGLWPDSLILAIEGSGDVPRRLTATVPDAWGARWSSL